MNAAGLSSMVLDTLICSVMKVGYNTTKKEGRHTNLFGMLKTQSDYLESHVGHTSSRMNIIILLMEPLFII